MPLVATGRGSRCELRSASPLAECAVRQRRRQQMRQRRVQSRRRIAGGRLSQCGRHQRQQGDSPSRMQLLQPSTGRAGLQLASTHAQPVPAEWAEKS